MTVLTVKRFAQRFGVSPRTVRDWIGSGLVKAKRDAVTGRLFIEESEVERRMADMVDREPGTRPPHLFPPSPPEPQEDDDMPTKVRVKKPAPEPEPEPEPVTEETGGTRQSASETPAPAPSPPPGEPAPATKEVKKRNDWDTLEW